MMTKVNNSLPEFLLARIEEDEAAAKAATPGPWSVNNPSYPESIYSGEDGPAVVSGSRWGGEASVFDSDSDAHHIARHDPARVLAECAAKRRIVEECAPNVAKDWPFPDGLNLSEFIVAELVQPYSDHPDYRDEWRA